MKNRKYILIAGFGLLAGLVNVAGANVSHPNELAFAGTMHDVSVAREATEGPRGGDRQRPGDRQRRGGKNAGMDSVTVASLDDGLVYREASSRGRGRDNRQPHR